MNTRYLTIPYSANGADWDGCDCYGLVQLWFREECGLHLPFYRGAEYQPSKEADATLFVEHIHDLFDGVELTELTLNDVLLIRSGKLSLPTHCGVVVAEDRFLHTMSRSGTSVANTRRHWDKIFGAYRHKEFI